jgi:hypothetical protein
MLFAEIWNGGMYDAHQLSVLRATPHPSGGHIGLRNVSIHREWTVVYSITLVRLLLFTAWT